MKRLPLVLGLALSLSLVALAPLPAARAADQTVAGTVTLAGAPVAATEVGWFDPTTGAGGETRTGTDGRYSLQVGEGHPFVIYAGIDHATNGRWLPLGADRFTGAFVGASGTDYLYQSLTPFTTASTVDVVLTAPGSIVGKRPGLAHQLVNLLTLQGNVVAQQRASATGRFEFAGLIPGRYRIAAFRPLKAYEPYTSGTLAVAAGATRRIFPRLVKTGTVTGVARLRGKPVKGIIVSVANVNAENGTLTDARGRYTVKHVPAGKVELWFSGQGTVGTGDYSYRGYQKHVTTTVTSGRTRRLDVAVPRPTLLTASITPTAGAKNMTVRLVDVDGNPAVDHYVKIGARKTRIPLSLPGIRAGRYTLVVTDNRGTRYAKKTVTLAYGKTTALGAFRLTRKTVSVSGAIVGALPYEVAFTNAYGIGDDLSVASGRYRITGLVPGPGVLRFNAGGRSGPKPYFTADNYYRLKLTTATSVDVTNGGPQLGLFTGTLAVGSLPVATPAYLSGETRENPDDPSNERYNEAYVLDGHIEGTAEIDDTGRYTLGMQYSGWPKEFVKGSPFWLELADGPLTVTTQRGTTVDVGTVQLAVQR